MGERLRATRALLEQCEQELDVVRDALSSAGIERHAWDSERGAGEMAHEAAKEIARLRADLGAAREANGRLSAQLEEAHAQVREKRKCACIVSARGSIERWCEVHGALKRENDGMRGQVRSLEEECATLRGRLADQDKLRRKLRATQGAHAEAVALAERYKDELDFTRGLLEVTCAEVCRTFGERAPGAAAMFDPDYVLAMIDGRDRGGETPRLRRCAHCNAWCTELIEWQRPDNGEPEIVCRDLFACHARRDPRWRSDDEAVLHEEAQRREEAAAREDGPRLDPPVRSPSLRAAYEDWARSMDASKARAESESMNCGHPAGCTCERTPLEQVPCGQDTMALVRAALEVRNGRWVKGAPTHVFADLLTALRDRGFVLARFEQERPHPDIDHYKLVGAGGPLARRYASIRAALAVREELHDIYELVGYDKAGKVVWRESDDGEG